MRALRGTLLTAALCVLCALPALAAAPDGAELYGAVEAAQTALSGAERRPDDDTLFYGYLLQRAGASDSASLMSDARSTLSAKDQELYDALRAFAAKVADGKETSAKCVITYEDFPLVWTKEQLGVSAILEINEKGKAQLTSECDDALSAKLDEYWGYNLEAVRNALLADCPYELYWYDKLPGSSMAGASDAPFGASESKVQFSEAPSYTVSVLVSEGYRGADEFTVNRNLHKGIDKVVSTAASIVSRYAGKSDYEKLLGYATEIGNLTEYDTDAAETADMPYGDPWQLISVFDGDDATNVVCEGYAKAFKYLCDLSSFSSEKTECRIVTGALRGGTGAGEHMWNVVTMGNGKNYLVDVTNSDGVRSADYLFLKGAAPDNAQATQYTFYKSIVYLYDGETLDLWDSASLTLDVADYEPAQNEPQVSAPLQVNGYNVSSTGKAVSMGDLRKGVKIAPDIAVTDSAPNAVSLVLAVYDGQGKMADLQIWALDLSKPLAPIQAQAVPQDADAVSAKFIILSESFAPLASAFPVE